MSRTLLTPQLGSLFRWAVYDLHSQEDIDTLPLLTVRTPNRSGTNLLCVPKSAVQEHVGKFSQKTWQGLERAADQKEKTRMFTFDLHKRIQCDVTRSKKGTHLLRRRPPLPR